MNLKTLRLAALLALAAALRTALPAQAPAAPAPATPPAATTAPATPAAPVDPTIGVPKPGPGAKRFMQLHESHLARAKAGPVGLLFLGDSITEQWNKAPHIWEHYYGKHQPANFGIGGDQTQHVIWRIENGELDGIAPKVVVLLIGTNNTAVHTADQIAAAVGKIIGLIRTKLPQTKVLLLAVYPRGLFIGTGNVPDPWEQRMAVIRALNPELAKLDDGANVRFLDINAQFLGNDGTIPKTIMPDQLHLSRAGYQLWADAMNPLLTEMMK